MSKEEMKLIIPCAMEGIAPKQGKLTDHELGANDIDKLPDSLLISIISQLAIKDAVRTSALSRRWRHLWKWIPSIDFDFDHQLQNNRYNSQDEPFYVLAERLATIAKHVFSSHLGTISSCRILHYSHNCQSNIAHWLEHLSKRGIQKLVLACHGRSRTPEDTWERLQSTIIHCSSLRALVLSSWELVDATPLLGFQNLRALILKSVHLTEKTIMDIISKCVALEWLVLRSCNHLYSVKIHSPRLKELRLSCLFRLKKIDIDAPSLTTLTLSYVDLTEEIIMDIISKCVALERLFLLSCNIFHSVKIHTPRLKWLELECLFHLKNIDIDAPSLTTLVISSVSVRMFIKLEVPNIGNFHIDHLCEGRINEMGTITKEKLETCDDNMDLLSRCVGLYGVSSRNQFVKLRKLFINVELTNIRHGIVLGYVLRDCVHIQVLHLEIEQYSAWDKSKSTSTLSWFESGYWWKWDAIDYFYYDLKTVTMNGFMGEPLELDFVNHLITKAPGL
ncbi:hypothetical protein MRB53_010480 [Persea americana]|uniref:Uncharacterized protein n=1 Tax=Persea americana TaxID=3435 RepID=A0ACC2LSP6_PERAE|nr:hypothetical protein MRB53_010480 [Persea americana]